MHRRMCIVVIAGLIFDSGLVAAPKDSRARYLAPVLSPDVPHIGLAAYKGDLATLKRFIAAGANIESAGKDGRRPLLLASAGGHIEGVKILLKAGADINARDHARETALHWATHRRETEIALLLLSHHAAVNIQDQFGETPLIWAAMVGDKTVVEVLLRLGANRKLKDVDGWTASTIAKRNKYNDIAALLR